MYKFVVTGGAGFIGSHIVEALLARGDEVVVVDNFSTGYPEYLRENKGLTVLNVDISDWTSLSKLFAYFKDCDGIFHLAAVARIQPSIFAPHLTHDSNVTGTLNILEMARMCDINRVIYSASSSCYGLRATPPSKETDPVDCQTPYAIAKYMGELYCQTWSKLHKLNTIRLRYFNVWGPRSPLSGPYAPVVSRFMKQAFMGEDITVVGDGSQRRDFTHVRDVVRANLAAMDFLPKGLFGYHEVFNIGTGKNYSILELAQKVADRMPANIIHVPERIGESRVSLADNQNAEAVLGWSPSVSLDEGLDELYKYYMDREFSLKSGKPI